MLKTWQHLLLMLKKEDNIIVPHCVLGDAAQPTSIQLVGICDAPTRAYDAVVYLIVTKNCMY